MNIHPEEFSRDHLRVIRFVNRYPDLTPKERRWGIDMMIAAFMTGDPRSPQEVLETFLKPKGIVYDPTATWVFVPLAKGPQDSD